MIVRCPECGSKGKVDEEFIGREIHCPKCGVIFTAAEEVVVHPEVKWYYAEGREKRGPISQDEFERLIGAGTVTPDTLVWRKGMADWQALAEIRGDELTSVTREEKPYARGLGDNEIHGGAAGELLRGKKATTAGGLNYAGAGKRFGAKVIDLIFLLTIASIVEGLSRKLFPEAYVSADIEYVYAATMLINLLLWSFYVTWFVGKFGATPGKIVFNLKIVTPTGGRVGYIQAFGRFCGEFVLGLSIALVPAIAGFMLSQQKWLAMVAFIATLFLFYSPIIFDSQKRGLHDRLIGTRVVIV